jgi:hypothetical protein
MSGDQSVIVGAIKLTLVLLAPAMPTAAQSAAQDELQSLRTLLAILNSMDVSGIVVLVDRLDETPLLGRRPDLMADLIRPLLSSMPYLELEGVGTKFFLPRQVFLDLRREIRTDRILTRHISWSDNSLREVLSKRLMVFSDNRVSSLSEFVEPETQEVFDRSVMFYAAKNPRNMLRILDSIVTEVCNLHDKAERIDRLGLESGIREFLRIRTSEGDASEYEGRLKERHEDPPLVNI